jgi:hypothetical protein
MSLFNEFVNAILLEDGPTTDFKELPESPPYGFIVDPSGKFTAIRNFQGHAAAVYVHYTKYFIDSPEGGVPAWTTMERNGFIRLVCDNDVLLANTIKPTNAARRTAQDIARWYNLNYVEEGE